MFKVILKHFIYERCIDVFFDRIYRNFMSPDELLKHKIEMMSYFLSDSSRTIKLDWTMEVASRMHKRELGGMAQAISDEIDKEVLEELTRMATSEPKENFY